MMSHPDSALHILSNIDTCHLYSRKSRARFSLLHTMAIDRNYIDTTNLGLIQYAVDYYRQHGNDEDRMRTFYYYGRILFNRGDYTSAIRSFLTSLDYSNKVEDLWMKGMICSLLGSTYNYNNNDADEMKYAKQALSYFSEYGNDNYIDNARFRLAIAFHNNRLFDLSDSLYFILCDSKHYECRALKGLASNSINKSPLEPGAAIKYFDEAISRGAVLSAAELYRYAYALILDGKEGAADKILDRLEGIPVDVGTYWWKYSIAKEKHDYAGALELFETYSTKRDSLINARLAQSLYRAESEHYAATAQEAKHHTERLRLLLLLILVSSCLSLFIFYLLRQRGKMKEKIARDELERKLSEAYSLVELTKRQSESYKKEEEEKLLRLRSSFASMYQSQFARMGRLFGTNLDISIHTMASQKETVEAIFSEIASGKKQQKKFEARINADLDNIIKKLRTDFPSFDDDTIRLLSYVIVGFKDSTIATILNDNPSTLRTRKSRLKQKILDTPTENTSLYKAFL